MRLHQSISRTPYLLLCLFSLNAAQAQDFNLFETIETTSSPTANPTRPGRESRVTASKPEFTLEGVSRIGDLYSVILEHRDGEKIVVRLETGNPTEIPKHEEYRIATVEAGSITLIYPADSPCIEFPESGVQCTDNVNIAELTLPTLPAVKANNQQSRALAAAAQAEVPETAEDVSNPFEILRARAQNENNSDPGNNPDEADRGARFTPRRIDPSEVPPGMRVVSTPFGDRLVQQ